MLTIDDKYPTKDDIPPNMFIGKLCRHGHKYGGRDESVRYNYRRRCIECHGVNFKTKCGDENPMWAGGRKINKDGYIEIHKPNHQCSKSDGYVLEHIAVWYDANGEIPQGYIIHHINEIRNDNNIENLKMLAAREHLILHNTKYHPHVVVKWVNDIADGITIYRIAKDYNTCWGTVKKQTVDFERNYPRPSWCVRQLVRESGLVEDICKHGVGHGNVGWLELHDSDGKGESGIHGCCGCCGEE